MKTYQTLETIITNLRCRKGDPDGITSKGAFWRTLDVRIANLGEDGLDSRRPKIEIDLECRHYRNGDVETGVYYSCWHEIWDVTGSRWIPVPSLGTATSIEEVITIVKGTPVGVSPDGRGEALTGEGEEHLTEALLKLGMAEAPSSPDDEPSATVG